MSLIWLFVLGLAKVVTGHFSATEIVLTIAVGICCLGGFSTSIRAYKSRSIVTPLLVFVLFLALQAWAIWFSLHSQYSRI